MDSLAQTALAPRPKVNAARTGTHTPRAEPRAHQLERPFVEPPPVRTSLLPRAAEGYAASRKVFDVTR